MFTFLHADLNRWAKLSALKSPRNLILDTISLWVHFLLKVCSYVTPCKFCKFLSKCNSHCPDHYEFSSGQFFQWLNLSLFLKSFASAEMDSTTPKLFMVLMKLFLFTHAYWCQFPLHTSTYVLEKDDIYNLHFFRIVQVKKPSWVGSQWEWIWRNYSFMSWEFDKPSVSRSILQSICREDLNISNR